ncbi:hypothetical protein GCM10010439_65090 [Actinocorallia aurantiaca]|uniref:Uncharacterized protein n=1 Tax=Actinocorallia aurantiaca TaxID=46204 RepID=A0ABP6H761_9ACTN
MQPGHMVHRGEKTGGGRGLSAFARAEERAFAVRRLQLAGAGASWSGGSAGRGVGEAEVEVFDVVQGLVGEGGDVVVVQGVDDVAAVAGAGDRAEDQRSRGCGEGLQGGGDFLLPPLNSCRTSSSQGIRRRAEHPDRRTRHPRLKTIRGRLVRMHAIMPVNLES